MNCRLSAFAVIIVLTFASCQRRNAIQEPTISSSVVDDFQNAKYRMQHIVSWIDSSGNWICIDHTLPEDQYFYPASTVKFPTAMVALEKAKRMGVAITDSMVTYASDGTVIYQGSIEDCVHRIFVVSDNEAYNRLFEWVGSEAIRSSIQEKGLMHTKIVHRVGESAVTGKQTGQLNRTAFYRNSNLVHEEPERINAPQSNLIHTDALQGVGYLNSVDSLVMQPFDFSKKNFISLRNLHSMMMATLYPNAVPLAMRWDLRESDLSIVEKYMSMLPKESNIYRGDSLADNYVKFLVAGDAVNSDWASKYKIYNKVGVAYGYLTDVACIEDKVSGKKMFISASIRVNENEIYNDGKYEYDTVGYKVLGALGREWVQQVLSK